MRRAPQQHFVVHTCRSWNSEHLCSVRQSAAPFGDSFAAARSSHWRIKRWNGGTIRWYNWMIRWLDGWINHLFWLIECIKVCSWDSSTLEDSSIGRLVNLDWLIVPVPLNEGMIDPMNEQTNKQRWRNDGMNNNAGMIEWSVEQAR